MSVKKLIFNKITISILGIFLVLEVIYMLFPLFVDGDNLTKTVNSILLEKNGAKLYTTNLKVSTYPNFTFKITADDVVFVDQNEKIFDADNLVFASEFLPIFLKRLEIKNFKSDNLTGNFIWRKGKYLGIKNKVLEKYFYSLGLKINAEKADISLKQHTINVYDEIKAQTIKYNSDNFIYDFTGKKIIVKGASKLLFGNEKADFNINAQIAYPLKKVVEHQEVARTGL